MKLSGLRVLDLSNFLPGPYLSLELADHGAEVIKIEQPGEGDPGRHIGLSDGPHTVFFRNLNRGKKSIALDLKSEPDRAALMGLVDSADVFIESFRPGVAARLGVDYQTLARRNAGLVYCSISAFGQNGPYRDRPAHDLAIESLAGALMLTTGSDAKPAMPNLPYADLLSGLQGLAGILMALLRRQATGKGDYIDIAMSDCMVAALRNVLGSTFAQGRAPEPGQDRTTGGSAFYRIYQTRDGGHIALAGQEPKFVHALLGALNRPDLAPLCLQGPGPHQAPVMEFLEDTFRQATRAEWETRLQSLDLCFGGVNTLPQALQDPQIQARGIVLRDAKGRPHIGSPIRFLHEPAAIGLESPALDQHRDLLDGPASR
ncbi:CaiB/BaiF CoA-transferase family protein [Bordetella sp. BOR01]|uniref:CaiB/BaiF CoA transferase family protein n=1 Tax=Bordetella sp. BOR01 TaxID=2854779 RepID=UPI001C46F21E|nr:CoA transferase [Bordetella sp. BOR01]MBV7486571.1 CoA transferase [Bordetella sp. BOR01]